MNETIDLTILNKSMVFKLMQKIDLFQNPAESGRDLFAF